MPIIRDGEMCYTTKEAKEILKKSLLEDSKKLENDLNKIKIQNKEELCIK